MSRRVVPLPRIGVDWLSGTDRDPWLPTWSGQRPGQPHDSIPFHPIGVVRSPYTESSQIPKGAGARHDAEGVLELDARLEPGLTDVDGFSHLFVPWIFDRSTDYDLMAHPPIDEKRPHGVFATRSPRRPNPIGLTVVRLLRREGTRLFVRGVDMLDGSPIIDLKPYLSSVPADELPRGWVDEAEARMGKGSIA